VVPRADVTLRAALYGLRTSALACLSALAGFGLVSSPGCGTDAKGVEDCRDIERARCNAAAACGIVTDVEACQRFYRDHCLHGMASLPPSPGAVDQCVETINSAGSCAKVGEDGAMTLLTDCTAASGVLTATGATYACDLVKKPELADRCAVLAGAEASGEGGAAGGGG
jgi:hypothetical protein